MAVLGGGAVSYERGTPVVHARAHVKISDRDNFLKSSFVAQIGANFPFFGSISPKILKTWRADSPEISRFRSRGILTGNQLGWTGPVHPPPIQVRGYGKKRQLPLFGLSFQRPSFLHTY